MYCDATGQPNPNGAYELVDGHLTLRKGLPLQPGDRVTFDVTLMDSTKPKTDDPKSIDEALSQRFKAEADRRRTDVRSWLAQTPQKEIEAIAAQVAAQFVSAKAGAGVASQFAKDSAMITDAEAEYRVAAARHKHELMHPGKPFTEDMAAAAIAKAGGGYASAAAVADAANETERARSEYRGALAAHKHLTHWRQQR